jgi:hypothetical protein
MFIICTPLYLFLKQNHIIKYYFVFAPIFAPVFAPVFAPIFSKVEKSGKKWSGKLENFS